MFNTIGGWALNELKRSYPRCNIQPSPCSPTNPASSEMSGVEMESPHKLMATAQQFRCEIPGIGAVSTMWVGHKGVRDIRRKLAEEETTSKVKELSTELRVLAKECMTAFEVAGLKSSDDPKIRKAVDLCSSYLPQTARCRVTTSTSIATLWKEQQSGSELPGPVDKKELATSILGEKLVDTLTEKNQQPPDVSYMFDMMHVLYTCYLMELCTV